MRLCWVLLPVVLIVASCATYRPIVDQQSVYSQAQYEQDLKECQQYADQVAPGKAALVGAGIGAGLGAISGLVVGAILHYKPGEMAALGAAIGGMNGAARAGASAGMSQVDVICQCLRGRGYTVLR